MNRLVFCLGPAHDLGFCGAHVSGERTAMRPTRSTPADSDPALEPLGLLNLDGHDPAEPLDDNLHHGRSWHRYRYCFRSSEPLRVLDAGCGTGRSSVAAARLNPGASVLGIDVSAAAVDLARERARAAGLGDLAFAVHDLATLNPDDFGRFDFVICRHVLGHADGPARLLGALARCLDPRGLVLATFPARKGRRAPQALRQTIDALAPVSAGLEERTRIGLEILQALRPDHPILQRLAEVQARTWVGHPRPVPEAAPGGTASPDDLVRLVRDALIDQHAWTLDEASALLAQAGLRLLYAATPWHWHPDQSFGPTLPEPLHNRLDRIDPPQLSRLIDALDPATFDHDYPLYACLVGHEPETPSWPRSRRAGPATFDRLVPHLTGLARPDQAMLSSSAAHGRTVYRTVSGAVGEVDRIAVLRLAAIDGRSSCGDIDRKLASRTRASDDTAVRQQCWITLADSGLILLEPPGIS
jgi:SAM-dependent methyltransferase